MKILHLSTSDFGGASEATLRLHRAFLDHGHESTVVVREKHSKDKDIIQHTRLLYPQKIWDLFIDFSTRSRQEYYFLNPQESVTFSNAERILSLFPYTPDVIVLHWISRFVNLETVYEIQKRTHAKVFWLMLDMAPMTGGCHYAWQCQGYQKRCGNCPAIRSESSQDLSSVNFDRKAKFIHKIHPVIIAPTNELYDQCRKSALFRASTKYKIMLPLDVTEFYPGNKYALRKRHHIASDRKVICFRSDNPNKKRKGFEYVVRCLAHLYKIHSLDIHIAIIGIISAVDRAKIPFPNTIFTSINNRELGDVYRLSDVFLCSSLQDSGPMMINESIACGLPVVSFPVGVTKDLVVEGKTGFVAKMKNSMDLAHKLNKILFMRTGAYKEMVSNCRKLAIKKLSFRSVMKKYEQIL